MLHSFKIVTALAALGAAFLSSPSRAAKLTAADRAWIDTCISQRKASTEKPARLRKYCACMEEIVDDNQLFADSPRGASLSAGASNVLEGRGAEIRRRMG